jgi:hypothetical protein
LCWVFSREGLTEYFPGLTSNCDPLNLCFLSSQDYRSEPLVPDWFGFYRGQCESKMTLQLGMVAYVVIPALRKQVRRILSWRPVCTTQGDPVSKKQAAFKQGAHR